MKKSILFALLATSVFYWSCASSAKKASGPQNNPNYKGKGGPTTNVIVQGKAQITSSGEQDAFNKAVQHAQRAAVEKVLGAMVQSSTLVKNSVLVEDKIYSKASGFVQKYEIVSEKKDGDTKIVEINATVVLADVKDDAMALGLLQDRVNRPKLIVLVDEKSLADGGSMSIARSTLQQIMMDKQFEFVEEAQLQKVLTAKNIQVSKLTGVKPEDIAAVAVDAGAQVILRGMLNSSKQNLKGIEGMENWSSVDSSLTLDAIYAADASIIASSTGKAKGANISLEGAQKVAIEKAAKSAASDIVDKI
ncbi:MAG: hypothetical protein JNM63_03330, partial [Spirochaetia bacterium]|nr:hypothetical protein [Spirochaetia bacterium]